MGDVVHAMPILSALRGRWPSAHLAWVVNRAFRELLEGHRDLDELIVYDRGGTGFDRAGIGGMAGSCAGSVEADYDLTIDLQGLLRSALMVAATRAKVRVGMADAREGARWFYTHHVDAPRLGCTRSTGSCASPGRSGADDSEPSFHLPIPRDARRVGRGGPGGGAPAARHPQPRCPVADEAMAAGAFRRDRPRRAVGEYGGGLVAVGSAGDRPLVDALRRISARAGAGPLRPDALPQLAALSPESDLMISNDTGPLHLAAAAGARVVGIYTCTSPQLTGPYGPGAPRSALASGAPPASARHAAGSTAWPSSRPTASGRRSGGPLIRTRVKSRLRSWPGGGISTDPSPHDFTMTPAIVKMGNLAKGTQVELWGVDVHASLPEFLRPVRQVHAVFA